MNNAAKLPTSLAFLSLLLLGTWGLITAAHSQSSNIAPNHSTECAIAAGPGVTNIACGGRTQADADSLALSRCSGCIIVAHFTHACAAYSETSGNNRGNTASAWAIATMTKDGADLDAEHQAQADANAKCSANGGIQCYVRMTTCDEGTYAYRNYGTGRAQ